MYAKNFLLERIRMARGMVSLAQKLADRGNLGAFAALCNEACEIVQSGPVLAFSEAQRIHLPIQGSRLAQLLEKIPERAASELQVFRGCNMPPELCGSYCSMLDAKLEIFLNENDSADEDDHFLVNMAMPPECLQPEQAAFAQVIEEHGSFAEFVLAHALPSMNAICQPSSFDVWVDLNASLYLGMELSPQACPRVMPGAELGRLLQWHELAMDCPGEAPGERGHNPGSRWQCLISKLLERLQEIEDGIAYEGPPEIQELHYARFLEVLEAARRAARNWSWAGAMPEAVNETVAAQTGRRTDFLKVGFTAIRQNVMKLDSAVQMLEPVAKKALATAAQIATLDIPGDNTFYPDYNLPELANFTLWTRNKGDLPSRCMALPLISGKYPSAGLLCSGQDWSETPGIAKNMEYLTHVIVHDSDLPWDELGKIDYITLRIDFSRQFHKAIGTDNAGSTGG